MDATIKEAAMLYVTNRSAFTAEHEGTLHQDYLDMLFLGASTRPDLAEQLPVILCGGIPAPSKHGIDGLPGESGYHIECKVTTTDTVRKARAGTLGNITINDPSQNIIDKYDDVEKMKFIFPIFVDGHLVVVFSVEWKHLRPYYVAGLESIHTKNQTSTSGKSAARNFSLTTAKWLPNAEIEFVNNDANVALSLLEQVKATKKIQARVQDYIIINGLLQE